MVVGKYSGRSSEQIYRRAGGRAGVRVRVRVRACVHLDRAGLVHLCRWVKENSSEWLAAHYKFWRGFNLWVLHRSSPMSENGTELARLVPPSVDATSSFSNNGEPIESLNFFFLIAGTALLISKRSY